MKLLQVTIASAESAETWKVAAKAVASLPVFGTIPRASEGLKASSAGGPAFAKDLHSWPWPPKPAQPTPIQKSRALVSPFGNSLELRSSAHGLGAAERL